MARKSIKRRRVQKPRTLAWSDVFANVFRLGAAEGWTPPETVQVRDTARGLSIVAQFRDEDGTPVRLMSRFAWQRCGQNLRLVDEQMSISLKVGGKASV